MAKSKFLRLPLRRATLKLMELVAAVVHLVHEKMIAFNTRGFFFAVPQRSGHVVLDVHR